MESNPVKRAGDKTDEEMVNKRAKLETYLVHCLKCPNSVFKSVPDLARHLRYDHIEENFTADTKFALCGMCKEAFANTTDLYAHIRYYHRQGLRNKCPLCTFVPEKPSLLEDHRMSVHKGAPYYSCLFCPLEFANLPSKREHEKTEHVRELTDNFCFYCQKSVTIDIKVHFEEAHAQVVFFPCWLCLDQTYFNSCEELLEHESKSHPGVLPIRSIFHHGIANHVCPYVQEHNCDFTAQWPRYLRHHLFECHLRFKCDFCSIRFLTKEPLVEHMAEAHEGACLSWECEWCKKAFPSMELKQAHELNEHLNQTIKCKLCHSTFDSCESKAEHSKVCHARAVVKSDNQLFGITSGPRPFLCKVCGETYEFYYSLFFHLKLKHGQTKTIQNQDFIKMEPQDDFPHGNVPKGAKKVKVRILVKKDVIFEKGVKAARTLKQHWLEMRLKSQGEQIMLNEINPKILQCGLCQEVFSQYRKLFFHLKSHHPSHKFNGDEHGLACYLCQVSFNTFLSLADHVKQVHSRVFQPFRCFDCKFGCDSEAVLDNHKMSVHRLKTHLKCSYCSMKFFSELERSLHFSIHHKNQSYEFFCDFCSDALPNEKELKFHLRAKHNDTIGFNCMEVMSMENQENPKVFVCARCPNFQPTAIYTKFAFHNMGMHSDEIAAQCGICQSPFDTVHDFLLHLSSQHALEYQKYRCSFCQYGTNSFAKLRFHAHETHPECPQHNCNKCFKSFSSENDLEDHLNSSHSRLRGNKRRKTTKVAIDENLELLECHFQGEHCSYTTESRQELLLHMGTYHDFCDDNPTCVVCQKSSNSTDELIDHYILAHNANSWFKCELCDKDFASKGLLKSHILRGDCHKSSGSKSEANMVSPPPELVECVYNCGYSLPDKDDLDEHMKIKHGQDRFKCHLCPRDCTDRNKFFSHHKEVHMGLRPFVCDGCGMNFSRKSNMTKHQRNRACKGYDGLRVDISDLAVEFDCDHCPKKFRYKQSLQQHVKRVHEKQHQHQCDACGQFFSQIHHLRRHRAMVHNQAEDDLPHMCIICENRFVTLRALKAHMQRYHDLNDPTKAEGGLKYDSSQDSLRPQLYPPKKCMAENCDFTAYEHGELDDHVKNEHNDRPFQCTKCSRNFKKAAHLKGHNVEVHLGLRPHVCENCGFSFARKTNLVKHQRNKACPTSKKDKLSRKGIHGSDDEISHDENADKEASNEDNGRKFLCDQCHKSFKYRQSLQYHIESIHLEKKNFACHICGKAFVRMQRLREHSARIHGDALVNPNHTCSECGREFITTGAWKLHMRKFHDIVVTEEQTVPHTSL